MCESQTHLITLRFQTTCVGNTGLSLLSSLSLLSAALVAQVSVVYRSRREKLHCKPCQVDCCLAKRVRMLHGPIGRTLLFFCCFFCSTQRSTTGQQLAASMPWCVLCPGECDEEHASRAFVCGVDRQSGPTRVSFLTSGGVPINRREPEKNKTDHTCLTELVLPTWAPLIHTCSFAQPPGP